LNTGPAIFPGTLKLVCDLEIRRKAMSSKAEIARINGAKSSGPITAEGKSVSSQNSLKHGLTGARVVLPGESQEDYDRLEASIVKRFKPQDEIERTLVHQMASALWRLDRIEAMEAALFDKAFKQQRELLGPEAGADEVRLAAYAEVAESKGFRMLSRHQGQLRRTYEKAWKEIAALQEDRRQEEQQQSEARVQNEPRAQLTARMIEQFVNPPMSRTFSPQPQRAAAGH
jgi:hypothetical protein